MAGNSLHARHLGGTLHALRSWLVLTPGTKAFKCNYEKLGGGILEKTCGSYTANFHENRS